MSDQDKIIADQLTHEIMNLIYPDEIPSYTRKKQKMLLVARDMISTAMFLCTRVDISNSKLSLNTIKNLVPKEEYADMEQQIRYDIEHPEEKKDENNKNMPDHVLRRTVEVDNDDTEFTLFK